VRTCLQPFDRIPAATFPHLPVAHILRPALNGLDGRWRKVLVATSSTDSLAMQRDPATRLSYWAKASDDTRDLAACGGGDRWDRCVAVHFDNLSQTRGRGFRSVFRTRNLHAAYAGSGNRLPLGIVMFGVLLIPSVVIENRSLWDKEQGAAASLPRCTTPLTRIIHDDFYCNRRYAAATSWHAVVRHASGRARSSRPQHTVSSMPRPLGAPRARLAWRLGGFVTNSRE